MKKIGLTIFTLCFIFTVKAQNMNKSNSENKNNFPVTKTESEWKTLLSPLQYSVLREKATEAPNTGKYNLTFEKGAYYCAACGAKLFKSDSKFESNCGWPSFDNSIKGAVIYKKDASFGMIRTEIICAKCGGHLGHIFDDGPTETGKRYCVNSASLNFDKKE